MTNYAAYTGRITKDLDIKTTQTGTMVLPFDLAVQRDFKNSDGEYDTDFISCLAFNKTAEFLANYAKKGYLLKVSGRMQNNNFKREDGTINYGMQLIVNSVDSQILFLNKSEDSQNNNNQNNYNQFNQQQQRGQAQPKQNGWQQQQQQNSPFANANGPIDINDDDLPF